MRTIPRHLLLTTTILAMAGLICAGPPLAASARETVGSRAPLWADRFVQGGHPAAAAASASEVFVTGSSALHPNGSAFATEAYSAATGARLWSARYKASPSSFATAIAASPDGTAVFVAGSDFATVRYDAATGARQWASSPPAPTAHGYQNAGSIAVSPDGSTVFVTGVSGSDLLSPSKVMTIAYSAQTGAQLWLRRYGGATQAVSLAVNQNGGAVYVTGYGPGRSGGDDYVTIAYNASTGSRTWVARYNGPANGIDHASAVAVSGDGREVAVTGSSQGALKGLNMDYATVAYRAANGTPLWIKRYHGPQQDDGAADLAFGPDGKLFVTGSSGRYNGSAYATIAYTAAQGRQLWVSRYGTPGRQSSGAVGVAVAQSGGQLYVTGTADGGARGINTVAYNSTSGKADWVSRYPQPGQSTATAVAIAVNRDFVFAIGHTGTGGGYITLAYPAQHSS